MKIYYHSDIHEEFNSKGPKTEFVGTKDDILVLAGDIFTKNQTRPFVESFSEQFKHVLYVVGNHDLWGANIEDTERYVSGIDNVHFLQNEALYLDNVSFFGCTLWTNYEKNPNYEMAAQRGMTDFRKIRCKHRGYKKIIPSDVVTQYNRSVNAIKKFIETADANIPKVVITHHAPSWKSCTRIPDMMAASFYSELDWLVEKADYWIHGHTHDPVNYMIGDCNVVSNPLGYRGYEHYIEYFEDAHIQL